jgi:nucleotidyltransferase/DNA polymerase involved in DNA repair
VKKVRDLKRFTLPELEKLLGKWGDDFYQRIRGKDDAQLQEVYEAKSIGEQETFLHDNLDLTLIFDRLKGLCKSVFSTFQGSGFETFRTVVVTVRFADFETKTSSHTLKEPINQLNRFEFEVMKLLMPFVDSRSNPRHKLIRLIGVRVEKLA